MLNASDVQKLRQQGQNNRQILELMAPVVPSARQALVDIDNDKATPDWQKDVRIGKMIDGGVPKNAPSGLPYLLAIGLNQADKTYQDRETVNQKPPETTPFSNAEYGQGSMNPLKNAFGMAGNFLSEAGSMVRHPIDTLSSIGESVMGAGQLAGRGVLKASDALTGAHTEELLKKIVAAHPDEKGPVAAALRTLTSTTPSQQAVLDLMQQYGVTSEGIAISNPDPNVQTMAKGMFEHPLLPSMVAGGIMEKTGAPAPIEKAVDATTGAVKKGAQAVADVAKKPAEMVKTYMQDRATVANAEAAVSPLEKLAMPEIDPRTAAAEGRALVTDSSGQPFAAMPTSAESAAAKTTLAKIPEFKNMEVQGIDPNVNLPQSAQIIENARKYTFGPAVEKTAGDINFGFGKNELSGVLQDAMNASEGKILAGQEGIWQKTQSSFLKKFESYLKDPQSDYTPSQAAWRAESEMMRTLPESQIDAPTQAKAMAVKTFSSAVRQFLLDNAERMARELEATGKLEDAAAAVRLRQFKAALEDYRNIKMIQDNIPTKMNRSLSPAVKSPGEILKQGVKSLAKPALKGAGFGAAAHLMP